MRKIFALILSALLFATCSVPALAVEVPAVSDAALEDTLRFATKADVYNEVSKLTMVTEPVQEDEVATVEDFLRAFSFHRRYILETADGFFYPAGDSMWMSAEEWMDLVSRTDSPITLEEVQTIVQRTIECDELLKTHHIPDTYDRYKDVLDAFFGEFSSLFEGNKEAAKYWVGVLSGGGVYEPAQFSSVLHEMAHERSARKAGRFLRRDGSGEAWQVIWSSKPSKIYPYNPKERDNQELQVMSLPSTLTIVSKKDVPKDVQGTLWYKTYFDSGSASNTFGIYGMLEEFCAGTIAIRCRVISTSIGYHGREFSEDYLQGYYFWDAAIGTYLSKLEEKYPAKYNELMADKCIIGLLNDTIEFIDEQIDYMRVAPTKDEEVLALKAWARESGVRNLLG